MNKRDLKRFEKRLLAEKARILKQLGFTGEILFQPQRDAGGDLSAYSSHMADQGTDASQREVASALTTAESRTLQQIDIALKKIRAGTYGACERCGKSIAKSRLEILPYATLCIRCKRQEDTSV